MPLTLLLPAGLAALAALLLPLLIHLTRRSEQRPTMFAAVRWLRALSRSRQRSGLDEWPLLLLRLIVLALLALLLAQPALLAGYDRRARVAVAAGLDPAQARAAVSDRSDARWLWLAPGFPAFDAPMPEAASAQASLLRELDATLPPETALTVVVPQHWSGLDGQVPVLSRPVRWRVVDGPVPALAEVGHVPPSLQVFAGDDAPARAALPYLQALQAAWHEDGRALDVQPASAAAVAAPVSVIVWIAAAPLPEALLQWAGTGGTLLLDARTPLPHGLALQPLWRDDNGIGVLDGGRFGAGRVLRFAHALDPVALPPLLDAAFPDRLRALLQPLPPARRGFAVTQLPMSGAAALPPAPQPLAAWLALAIALLFLLERALASSPRRGRHE